MRAVDPTVRREQVIAAMPPFSQPLDRIVKAARNRKGLTIAEAARRCGVSPQTYIKWETQRHASAMRLDTLARLCAVLDLQFTVTPTPPRKA